MNYSKFKNRTESHHTLTLDFATPIAGKGFIHDAEKRQLVSQILNMTNAKERRILSLKSIGYDYTEIAHEIHVSPKVAEDIMTTLRNRIIARFPVVAAAYGAEVSYA